MGLTAKIREKLYSSRVIRKLLFERRYSSADPYQAKSAYQLQKFVHGFRLLPEESFKSGLELGCGEGVNTWRLAERCQRVLAVDLSRLAIRRARRQNAWPNVRFEVFDLAAGDFGNAFDYVFCADVLYYLSRAQLDRVASKMVRWTAAGGILHLIHCRSVRDDLAGEIDKPFGAKTIHDLFARRPELAVLRDEQVRQYRVTVYRKLTRS